MLSDRCPVCLPVLSVGGVGVSWPNSGTDQDETWNAGRPRRRSQCVKWRPSSPQKGHSLQFSARIYCGQTVAHLSYCSALVIYCFLGIVIFSFISRWS